MDNERLNIWLNFIKFILASFALALVSIVINAKIQEREICLKEQEHLAEFTRDILQEDIGPKLLLAEYFAYVTQSENLRNSWQNYYELLKLQYDAKDSLKIELQYQITKLHDSLNTIIQYDSSKLNQINSLKTNLNKKEQDLEVLKKQLSTTISSFHDIYDLTILIFVTDIKNNPIKNANIEITTDVGMYKKNLKTNESGLCIAHFGTNEYKWSWITITKDGYEPHYPTGLELEYAKNNYIMRITLTKTNN